MLSADEAGKRFPQLRFAAGEVCVYDPWAGYIESARAIGVMAGLARDGDCRVFPSTPVTSIEERASHVEVRHRGGHELFDRVVVAAGPWLGWLLPTVGAKVRITRQQMLLIEPPDPRAFSGDRFPVWMIDEDGEGWYGFPLLRGGYAKVARDRLGETVDPDVERAGTEEFCPRRPRFRTPAASGAGRRSGPSRAAPVSTPTRRTTTSWWTACRGRSGYSSPVAAAATASSSAARSGR